MEKQAHDNKNRREFVKAAGLAGMLAGGLGTAQTAGAISTNAGGYSVQDKDSDKWDQQMQEYPGGPFIDTRTEVATGVGEFTWSTVKGSEYWHKVIKPEMCAGAWKQGDRYGDIERLYLSLTYPEQYTVNAESRAKSRGAYEVPDKDTNWNSEDEDAAKTLMSGLISIMGRNPAFSAAKFIAEMGAALSELTDSTDRAEHYWNLRNLSDYPQHSAGGWFKATAEMLKNECMEYTVEGVADRAALDQKHGVQVSISTCSPEKSPKEAALQSVSASSYQGDASFMTVTPKQFKSNDVSVNLPEQARAQVSSGTPIVIALDN